MSFRFYDVLLALRNELNELRGVHLICTLCVIVIYEQVSSVETSVRETFVTLEEFSFNVDYEKCVHTASLEN